MDKDLIKSGEADRLSRLKIPYDYIGVYDNNYPIVTVDHTTLSKIIHDSIEGRFIAEDPYGTYSGVYTDEQGVQQIDTRLSYCCVHRFVSGWSPGRKVQHSHYKGQYYHPSLIVDD